MWLYPRLQPAIEKGFTHFFSWFSAQIKLLDKLFGLAFYICVALPPFLIGNLGHSALFVPLLCMSGLVVTWFFMREDCRCRMRAAREFATV